MWSSSCFGRRQWAGVEPQKQRLIRGCLGRRVVSPIPCSCDSAPGAGRLQRHCRRARRQFWGTSYDALMKLREASTPAQKCQLGIVLCGAQEGGKRWVGFRGSKWNESLCVNVIWRKKNLRRLGRTSSHRRWWNRRLDWCSS